MKRDYYSDLTLKVIITALAFFLLACLAFGLVSCKPKQQIIERTLTVGDTVRQSKADTLRLISERTDSVIIRDSVFTLIKGDTVFIKEYHFRDLTKKVGIDSYKASTDTVWRTRTVTVYKTRTVETEKKLNGWQKALMWSGVFAWVAVLILVGLKLRRKII